ncbi:hypothetical protein MLD38_021845 [Melastoma candidum]|uniref:Uncharacterized protein n=1 Tax=Melastoma candidum TaxID=119954 RepID=A0ACB9QHB2_9MYRT|nr:hypothetical protein MLD38_021845 [Melastoma candidum]
MQHATGTSSRLDEPTSFLPRSTTENQSKLLSGTAADCFSSDRLLHQRIRAAILHKDPDVRSCIKHAVPDIYCSSEANLQGSQLTAKSSPALVFSTSPLAVMLSQRKFSSIPAASLFRRSLHQ